MDQLTVAVWFRRDQVGKGNQGLFQLGRGSDGQSGFALDFPDDRLHFTVGLPDNLRPVSERNAIRRPFLRYLGEEELSSGWHLVVVAYDGLRREGHLLFYIDGRRVGAMDAAGQLDFRGASLRIGNLVFPGKEKSYIPFSGWIDEVAIFRRPLTVREVRRIYAAGKPVDSNKKNSP